MNLLAALCESAKFAILLWALGFTNRSVAIALALITIAEFAQNCIWDKKYGEDEEKP